ncbi:MAG: MFS transporter [Neisseriaceae bacterium]|nr:MFS transporter [Neisseriaceae bacterium]
MQHKKLFNLLILYLCTILTMGVMYAPQPLQPYFEQMLGISKTQAALFTTAILVPLSFSSIFYGYLLEKISIRKLLITVFFIFSLSEFLFATVSTYPYFISIRILQGFIVPAALTGIMSYISHTSLKDRIGRAIGAYIGMTIAGGFLGRFLAGFCTDVFGWRFFFYALSILLLIVTLILTKTLEEIQNTVVKPKLSYLPKIWSIKRNLYIFTAIFGLFFVFQATLNVLPFELKRLDGVFSGSKTGFMYAGYVVGIFVSFNVSRIVKIFRQPENAVLFGLFVYLISLQILHIEQFAIILLATIVFYFGSFTAHSIATAYINKKTTSHKPITNGMYISSYYCGGALGSFLPGFIYAAYGWHIFLGVLSGFVCVSIVLILLLKRYEHNKRKKNIQAA